MELDVLRDRWVGVRRGLAALFGQLEDGDLSFVPFPGSRDVGALLRHIAHEEEIEVTWGARRALLELPPEPAASEYATLAGIRPLLESVHEGTLAYLGALTQAAIEARIETAWGESTRLGDLLWHALEHEIHHRGELSLILGMLGREGIQA